ncbi:hypothetical protein F5Y18DRAFT_373250 [Xylariaceae sp. FL1019]|nr:hypothetical protein F5Y18DRAFT_373250 [Xylariaceae sp. FL1019]
MRKSTIHIPAYDNKVTIKAILMYNTEDNRTFGQAAILKGRLHFVNTETSGEVMGPSAQRRRSRNSSDFKKGFLPTFPADTPTNHDVQFLSSRPTPQRPNKRHRESSPDEAPAKEDAGAGNHGMAPPNAKRHKEDSFDKKLSFATLILCASNQMRPKLTHAINGALSAHLQAQKDLNLRPPASGTSQQIRALGRIRPFQQPDPPLMVCPVGIRDEVSGNQ